ncbi:putative phage abortive infection protein [Aquabacterium sp.]|uniref:putative phage abortive infection protein n=1 Tax=Aquabacterium sp. TaxID=1872578 RepID=UPI004037C8C7
MIDYILNKAIEHAIPPAAPASDVVQYYGQVGDFIGGLWGTLIGAITLIVVALTWYSTHKINEKSKKYQIFSEILRSHEEIVSSITLGNASGREAFGAILGEFYGAYSATKELNEKTGRALSLNQRIDIAFIFTYYGAHPETVRLLGRRYFTFDGNHVSQVLSKKKKTNNKNRIYRALSEQTDGDPIDNERWQQSIHDALGIVKRATIPDSDKHVLRDVLTTSKHLPKKKINKKRFLRLIEDFEISSEFGGHQNRLSNYFRNLYSAFTFIQDSGLSRKEKYALAKVLRSKLSNYEQALLALNCLSDQGADWIKSGILNDYAPIKNIPEHFFSFDEEFILEEIFSGIKFEWKK